MADKTSIEWTETTWNPTTGCDRVSPGCDNCYALTLAKRLKAMGSAKYQRDGDPKTSGPGFGVGTHADTLDDPLHWREPRKVFVNSMSDLFHEEVPDRFIGEVFSVMGATPRHTYQILTKRHGRMRSLLRRWSDHLTKGCRCPSGQGGCSAPVDVEHGTWPLPNVHIGVSAEDQHWADIRIPALLDTPAAVRWVSAEPLLNPLSLRPGQWIPPSGGGPRVNLERHWEEPGPSLDWVVVGGESGPGARRLGSGWIRHIVEECQSADVPVFVKQMGSVWASDWSVDGKTVASHGDRKGGNWDYWPEDLRVREFPAILGETTGQASK